MGQPVAEQMLQEARGILRATRGSWLPVLPERLRQQINDRLLDKIHSYLEGRTYERRQRSLFEETEGVE
jgi:hypothetical protein